VKTGDLAEKQLLYKREYIKEWRKQKSDVGKVKSIHSAKEIRKNIS
jgi:ribosomal protein L29